MFEIGDRVKIKNQTTIFNGDTGTIVDFEDRAIDRFYLIDLDRLDYDSKWYYQAIFLRKISVP